jgi:hypothetical protein
MVWLTVIFNVVSEVTAVKLERLGVLEDSETKYPVTPLLSSAPIWSESVELLV